MIAPTLENQAPKVSFERERGVYAILVTHDVAHAVLQVGDDSMRAERILQVFRVLAASEIPIFLIKLHRTAVTFALAGTDLSHAQEVLAGAGLQASTRRDLALVAIRAASMRDLSGVMAAIADALYAAGARLHETGDSHNSVLCLIEEERAPDAVGRLRETFLLEADAVTEDRADAEAAA